MLRCERWQTGLCASVCALALAALGCGSEPATAAGKTAATSGDEDLSMTAMARRVGAVQTPVNTEEEPQGPKTSVPSDVPKLVDVKPETTSAESAANEWGTPDAESGAPLPKRPTPSGAAASSYQDGVRALQTAQLDAAGQAFGRSVSADGKAYESAYAQGVVADRQGQPDEALKHYARALQIQPDYEAAVQGTVNVLQRRGDTAGAVRFVEPIARQWQRNPFLQAIYADALIRDERVDEAEQVARTALKRDERFVPAIVSLTKASLHRGRVELADDMLQQAAEIDPRNAEVAFLQAKRLQAKGDLTQALVSYRKAIELNPDYAEARMALGIQSMAGGNYTEALTQFEAAVTLVPTLVAAHLNLGDVYRALRRWQDAKREFDKALRMQTELPEAHYNLGLMYMTVGSEFPNLTEIDALGRSLTEFNTYRTEMGARLTANDPSGAYMVDVQRRIDREKKRIEREKAKAEKDAQRKARDAEKPAEGAPKQ
jgi:tetratricopeptide (TPR) repeat protein